MRKTCAVAATVTAMAFVAAGCGSDDGGGEESAGAADAVGNVGAPAPGSSGVRPSTAPVPAPDHGSQRPPKDSESLGGREAHVDHDPVRLDIVELTRSGATSALTIRLTTTSDDTPGAQIAGTLDDGISDDAAGNEYDTVDGITLIDTANRKRYLVARDSTGRCVCDNELSSTFVERTAPTVLSATFAAPPEGVETVDVVIPKFGTFKNVPLS